MYPELSITSTNYLLCPGIDSKTFQRCKCVICYFQVMNFQKIKTCDATGPYGRGKSFASEDVWGTTKRDSSRRQPDCSSNPCPLKILLYDFWGGRFWLSCFILPFSSEVLKRGWRTEGVGAKQSFLCQRLRPLFCALFPMAPLGVRHISGELFWLFGGLFVANPPANPFSKSLISFPALQ